MYKVCTACKESLSVSCFLVKSQTGLLLPTCKVCTNLAAREVRLAIKNGQRPPKLTPEFKTAQFIEKALVKHGGAYSYERVRYTDKMTKVEIFCTKHNDYFLQSPCVHLTTSGCSVCGPKEGGQKAKITEAVFLTASKEAHGDGRYDYSQVAYEGRDTPVAIRCKKHDLVFSQAPSTHMVGKTGCMLCYKAARAATVAKTAADAHVEGHWLCKTCSEVLPTDNFLFRKGGLGKLYSVCRKCRAKRSEVERDAIQSCPLRSLRKKTYAADYTRRNSAAANVKSTKRRVRKMTCTPNWTDTEYEALFLIEIYSLAALRESCTGFKWHVDHVVPLTSDRVCGLHCSDNLQLLPALENLSKGNYYWPDMP